MNSCMIFSAVLAIVIMLRILFIMKEIGEIGNTLFMTGNNPPFTKQLLRGAPTIFVAYERFEKIRGAVMFTAATGGHTHKYNLCYKNIEVITIIDAMVREAFPDSKIEHAHVQNLKNNCTAYKINW